MKCASAQNTRAAEHMSQPVDPHLCSIIAQNGELLFGAFERNFLFLVEPITSIAQAKSQVNMGSI